MSENTWPGGVRHAMAQSAHDEWNSHVYPGTLQLCSICDEPTGRCEDDTIWSEITSEPLCADCLCAEEAAESKGGE